MAHVRSPMLRTLFVCTDHDVSSGTFERHLKPFSPQPFFYRYGLLSRSVP